LLAEQFILAFGDLRRGSRTQLVDLAAFHVSREQILTPEELEMYFGTD
jgi:hypothetical protein